MTEKRQGNPANGLVRPIRIHHAVGRRREVTARRFLQHVADVDDQVAKVTGHLQPAAIVGQNLQARLVGRRQNGDQVDVLMRCRADRRWLFIARQWRVVKNAQQVLGTANDHLGQRLSIVRCDFLRGLIFDPLQQLSGQRRRLLMISLRRYPCQFLRRMKRGQWIAMPCQKL